LKTPYNNSNLQTTIPTQHPPKFVILTKEGPPQREQTTRATNNPDPTFLPNLPPKFVILTKEAPPSKTKKLPTQDKAESFYK